MKKITGSFCDWKGKVSKKEELNQSRFYKYKGNFSWNNIKKEKYKQSGNGWKNIVRQTLIGNHGETTKFHVRYFEISPGGYSSFEKHHHEHVVIGLNGEGICIVGKKKYHLRFLDVIYIKPNEPHQLRNPFEKPFGFLCIVNSRRDKPVIIP